MTTSDIKGPCANDCGRPAQVRLYNPYIPGRITRYTPLCFDCFHDDYNRKKNDAVTTERPQPSYGRREW